MSSHWVCKSAAWRARGFFYSTQKTFLNFASRWSLQVGFTQRTNVSPFSVMTVCGCMRKSAKTFYAAQKNVLPFSVTMESVCELPNVCIWFIAWSKSSTTSIAHSNALYSICIDLAATGAMGRVWTRRGPALTLTWQGKEINDQGPVLRSLDSAIHRINPCPVNKIL